MAILLTTLHAKNVAAAPKMSAVLAELKATTHVSAETRGYEVFVSEADATTFYIKESWDRKEKAELHPGCSNGP
jgi:quinol monooxygenase YgiN